MKQDSRIPVLFGQQAGPDDAVLLEEGLAPPANGYVVAFAAARPDHAIGCLCCAPRTGAAAALAAAFRARATGAAPFFMRAIIMASPIGGAEMRTALAEDALARARYRLED